MPTLLDELTLGTAVVDDYSLKNQRRIYYSSSGQMELDEQPIQIIDTETDQVLSSDWVGEVK